MSFKAPSLMMGGRSRKPQKLPEEERCEKNLSLHIPLICRLSASKKIQNGFVVSVAGKAGHATLCRSNSGNRDIIKVLQYSRLF